jgi:hypothetical protein
MHRHTWQRSNVTAVKRGPQLYTKTDENSKRSADHDFHLYMVCVTSSRTQRNRNSNAAINNPRMLRTELKTHERPAYVDQQIIEKERK